MRAVRAEFAPKIECLHELRSRTESAMRTAILALSDGTWHSEAVSDGIDQPIRLKLALTAAGDRIVVCLAYTTAYTTAYTAWHQGCAVPRRAEQ